MAAVAAATKMSLLTAAARSAPPAGAAAAATAAAPFPQDVEQARARKRPRSTTTDSQESAEDAGPQSRTKHGSGLAGGVAPRVASGGGGITSDKIALESGSSHRSGAEPEAQVQAEAEAARQGMDVEGHRPPGKRFGGGVGAGVQSDAAAAAGSDRDTEGEGEGEEPALSQLLDGNRQRNPTPTPREPEDFGGAEDAEAVWMEREQAAGGGLENSSRGREGAGVAGGVNGEGRVSPRLVVGSSTGGGGGDGSDSPRNPGGGASQLAARAEWRPKKGDLVEVQRRMTPGVNKPGGTGSVVKVNATTRAVDVRYMVEGYWERDIDPVYVRPATLNLDRKRPTLGRCEHCGSLRVDCRQECDYFTAPPPPHFSGSHTDGSEEEGGLAERVARQERRRQHSRRREHERRRRRRRHRRTRPSEDGGDIGEGVGRHTDSQNRRRHLPEDYDEEGEPVGGSSQEEGQARSGSSNGSDAPLRGVGRQRSSRVTRRLVGSSSSGSGSDGGIADSEGRERWRLGDRSDKRDDVGNGLDDDSDVELLDVRRSTNRRSDPASRGSSGSTSSTSSRSRSRSLRDGGGSDSSEGRRGRGREFEGAGGAADACFLQPEGEEDELPPDIPDPTRGVQNREQLQEELLGLLEKLEGNDAAELENDAENETVLEKIAAAVRR